MASACQVSLNDQPLCIGFSLICRPMTSLSRPIDPPPRRLFPPFISRRWRSDRPRLWCRSSRILRARPGPGRHRKGNPSSSHQFQICDSGSRSHRLHCLGSRTATGQDCYRLPIGATSPSIARRLKIRPSLASLVARTTISAVPCMCSGLLLHSSRPSIGSRLILLSFLTCPCRQSDFPSLRPLYWRLFSYTIRLAAC